MGAISFSGSGESPRSLTTTGNSTEASFPPSDNVIQGDLPSAGPSRAGPDLSLAWSAQSDHTLAAGRCAPAPELLRGRCTRTSKTWSDGAREIPSHRSPECPLASARSIRPRSLRSLRAPPSLLRRPSVRAFCGAAAIAIGCNAGRPARPRRPSRGGGDERRRQLRAARPPRRRLREVRPLPEGSGPGRCRLHVLDREGGDLILPLRRPRRPAVGGRAARRPPPRSRRPATGASEPGGRPRRDRAASVQPFVVRARRRVCRASLFLIRAARAGEVACVS